jgi:hypothetical protein
VVGTIGVRLAESFDIPRIVELQEQRRLQYQEYQPTLWRKAEESADEDRAYLENAITDATVLVLVHDRDATVDGAIVGVLSHLSPMYNPGGPVCVVDDFVVASPELWNTVGVKLLNAMAREAHKRGAAHLTVSCGYQDRLKRTMLALHGCTIASAWHVRDLLAPDETEAPAPPQGRSEEASPQVPASDPPPARARLSLFNRRVAREGT